MKKILCLILIACLFISVSSCKGKRKTLVEIGNEKGILHIGNGDEPGDLDPQLAESDVDHNIAAAISEGLVSQNFETMEIVPGVADSWTVSSDGRTYTFHIRDEARWSNGEKIVAQDFVDSYKRALMPALGSQWLTYYYVMENAEKFYKGEIKDFGQVGVHALSEQELEFKLVNPTPYFLQLLYHPSMYPVHIKTILKFGAIDERNTRWTRPENFVGNGPFVPKSWVPQYAIIVKRNPYYWDQKNIHLNEIYFYPTQKDADDVRQFKAGRVHITLKLFSNQIVPYRQRKAPELHSFPLFATSFYALNIKVKPLDNVYVRKALAFSIDRSAIVKQITKGAETPAFTLAPASKAFSPKPSKIFYSPEKAREFLAKAGYPNGENFPKLTILFNTAEINEQIATTIQQMWKKELNIDVELQNQEFKTVLQNLRNKNFQIGRYGWVGDYVDPDTFMQLYKSNSGYNESGWQSEAYDQFVDAANAASTPQERAEFFQKAEDVLDDEVPIIPLYYQSWNKLVSPSVKGWHDHPLDFYNYKGIYLESEQTEAEKKQQ